MGSSEIWDNTILVALKMEISLVRIELYGSESGIGASLVVSQVLT